MICKLILIYTQNIDKYCQIIKCLKNREYETYKRVLLLLDAKFRIKLKIYVNVIILLY